MRDPRLAAFEHPLGLTTEQWQFFQAIIHALQPENERFTDEALTTVAEMVKRFDAHLVERLKVYDDLALEKALLSTGLTVMVVS